MIIILVMLRMISSCILKHFISAIMLVNYIHKTNHGSYSKIRFYDQLDADNDDCVKLLNGVFFNKWSLSHGSLIYASLMQN